MLLVWVLVQGSFCRLVVFVSSIFNETIIMNMKYKEIKKRVFSPNTLFITVRRTPDLSVRNQSQSYPQAWNKSRMHKTDRECHVLLKIPAFNRFMVWINSLSGRHLEINQCFAVHAPWAVLSSSYCSVGVGMRTESNWRVCRGMCCVYTATNWSHGDKQEWVKFYYFPSINLFPADQLIRKMTTDCSFVQFYCLHRQEEAQRDEQVFTHTTHFTAW